MLSPVSAGSVTVDPATVDGQQVDTLVGRTADSTSVVAVLDEGQDEVVFDLGLPDGAGLVAQPDGSLLVGRASGEGVELLSVIARPWAKDASGKALPTRYEVDGDRIIQRVDTAEAEFPVVADPTITDDGFWGTEKVIYVQFSRGETETIYNIVQNEGIIAAATWACSRLPHPVAVGICAVVVVQKYGDLKNNVKKSHEERKCLKARVPISMAGGLAGATIALDFYRKSC